MHPHIGERCTKNSVNKKGRKIKHIKSPERVRVELPDLWKGRKNVWQSGIGTNILLKTGMAVVCLSSCRQHGLEYHDNIVQKYFTKSAIPDRHAFILSQGNLRISRNECWFLVILRQKSTKNYPLRKLEYLRPRAYTAASQCAIWKIFATCIFFLINIFFFKLALGKGLKCVELEKATKVSVCSMQFFVWFLQHC